MKRHVIGMDGCRGGWLLCRLDVDTLKVDLIAVVPHIQHVLDREVSATHMAIDIPIGLPKVGCSRKADVRARSLLTRLRGSSVFPAPPRELLTKHTHSEANAYSKALCGKGVPRQAHAIFPKIAQVDEIMTPELQDRLFEVHPELCFWGLAGAPMQHSKKTHEGYEERRRILSQVLSTEIPRQSEVRNLRLPIEADDLLDALVAGVSALRASRGDARRIPDDPEIDGKGLRMEMVY